MQYVEYAVFTIGEGLIYLTHLPMEEDVYERSDSSRSMTFWLGAEGDLN